MAPSLLFSNIIHNHEEAILDESLPLRTKSHFLSCNELDKFSRSDRYHKTTDYSSKMDF